ncbi:hypothetical protein [Lysobacter capsici]|uniref:hypothetical protein n=1 Tax=Lysobacter capsici TaxID=435897 RepID=UPI00287B790B|nr:hypothetical protein [Lysobacter capsici]WND79739.1 hypothetical protein RJ610_21000 [Lysobacter capsici]WND84935.1 hypothetical protein RJ609_21015 [Lysobacter capsici]
MNHDDDDRHIDRRWLVCDAIGQVAAFTTAGSGPIPHSARAAVDRADAGVEALPIRGAYRLIAHAGNAEDWISCAQSDLFAYDWSDIVADDCGYAYELLAVPLAPIRLPELPSPLREIAAATTIAHVVFGENDLLSRRLLPGTESPA